MTYWVFPVNESPAKRNLVGVMTCAEPIEYVDTQVQALMNMSAYKIVWTKCMTDGSVSDDWKWSAAKIYRKHKYISREGNSPRQFDGFTSVEYVSNPISGLVKSWRIRFLRSDEKSQKG